MKHWKIRPPLFALLLLVAACGSDTADTSYGETLLDQPLPTVEQLQSATQCSELNRLMAGVENETFRVNAERTLAEEKARAADEYENTFDVYYRAFSERQADLECSDAEMMSVLQTASGQRCEQWMDSGHSPTEEPLLLNTAHCSGGNA